MSICNSTHIVYNVIKLREAKAYQIEYIAKEIESMNMVVNMKTI